MSIFEAYTEFGPVLVGLFTMMLAFYYFKRQDDSPHGGGSMTTACFAMLLSKLTLPLQTMLSDNIAIPIFLELMLTWISMSYFIFAGVKLAGKKSANVFPVLLVLIGLVINGQMVFGLRDGDMVLKARLIYPAIGFLFLGIKLFMRKQYKYASGFNILSWVSSVLGAYYVLQLLPFEGLLSKASLFPALCYLLMAIAAMLMVNNLLGQQAQKYAAEANESRNRLKLIIQSSPFPITISRLKDDQLMMLNNKSAELFGLDASNPGTHRTVDFFADKSNRQDLLARLEKNKVVEDFEVLVKKPMGEPFWLLLSARVIDYDYDIAIYCAFQDITGRKQREQELFSKATTDPLTGAYNRRQFEELALKEVQRSKRYGNKFCMLMIDADHFKKVNDTYGHASGDEVLKALAKCCFDTVRESDIVARFGGEEFVILLSEVSMENAFLVSERLRVAISKLNVVGEHGEDIHFTVSMGLVESSSKVTDPTTLIKMADEALYKAKEGGRNRVIVYPRTEGEFNPDNFVSASVAAERAAKASHKAMVEAVDMGAKDDRFNHDEPEEEYIFVEGDDEIKEFESSYTEPPLDHSKDVVVGTKSIDELADETSASKGFVDKLDDDFNGSPPTPAFTRWGDDDSADTALSIDTMDEGGIILSADDDYSSEDATEVDGDYEDAYAYDEDDAPMRMSNDEYAQPTTVKKIIKKKVIKKIVKKVMVSPTSQPAPSVVTDGTGTKKIIKKVIKRPVG